MDPDLIDLVWEIHTELGSAEPIHIISGYRSRDTNDMLRRTVGGQASQSRHILGKAMDVHFPDVPVKKLRYSALIRERGGVGYYPTSATPFVHIDTDRVRAWPRLPRTELALLFPSGRTQHVPDDGGPITPEDVRRARAANTELAAQIAEFHELRAQPRPPVQVASLDTVAAAAPGAAAPGGAAGGSSARGRATRTARGWRRCRRRAAAAARRPRRRRSAAGASAGDRGGEMRVAAADPTPLGLDRLKQDASLQPRTQRSCRPRPTTRSIPRSCPIARSRSRRS